MRRFGHSLKKITGAFFILFLYLSFVQNAKAQNYAKMRRKIEQQQKQTRSEINQLKQQVSSYVNQISQTEKKFSDLKKEYDNLKKEIALRNAVIRKLAKERDEMKREIQVTEQAYNTKDRQLKKLIANYKKTLTYLYIHGRSSELALILTSRSFNQMLIRAYYLRKFEQYREHQAKEIKKAQADLKQREKDLTEAREKNENVLSETKNERQTLRKKIRQRSKVISALRNNKQSLQVMLRNTRQQVDNLNNTLSDLIQKENKIQKAEELRRKRLETLRKKRLAEAEKIKNVTKRKEEVAKYSKPLPYKTATVSNAQLQKFGREFADEKGKLPWPVNNGVVTAHFGTKYNPVYHTRITSLGIEIAAKPQSRVHVVSTGYVFAVKPLTGFDNLVFVNHGKYKTVYGNLSKVFVHKGMIVHKGDVIGLSGNKYSAQGSVVFFMIRDGNHNVNPLSWIRSHPK